MGGVVKLVPFRNCMWKERVCIHWLSAVDCREAVVIQLLVYFHKVLGFTIFKCFWFDFSFVSYRCQHSGHWSGLSGVVVFLYEFFSASVDPILLVQSHIPEWISLVQYMQIFGSELGSVAGSAGWSLGWSWLSCISSRCGSPIWGPWKARVPSMGCCPRVWGWYCWAGNRNNSCCLLIVYSTC